ncbi:glycosyltransferase family 4 protein [Bacillus sp. V33-4]|uniref:glycosyltransferase family 4 protein n=1 Tax=Bacillus sp. V33-4 TaxID=2054169 RepID=UPI000C762AB6|nr:glycosyltransferase family 4 protein [Bacillus sp. V33-4]PLR87248.1 glycosyltransferase family 1 protein [Bacillus sp. V33-4]
MKKKVFFCATVDYHFKAFHLPYLKWFKDQGWEVHVAASGKMMLPYVDKKYNIPIQRSPFSMKNIIAYKELKNIIDQNKYQIIHCHTPMGGVLARLAARFSRNNGTKLIYTAHGFHFCKGAPILNWFLYYPIEKMLAKYTDCLITINEEDNNLANKKNFKAQTIKHVHGVGVNTDLFFPVKTFHKSILRTEYGYNDEDFLMFYAAEFNKNKNQQLLIKSLARIKDEIPYSKLLVAGDGPLLEECKQLAIKLGVIEKVDFLGYRTDIVTLLKISDVAVASSLREGLPVNILEAMSCGLPIIASVNRGHSELVKNGLNGYIVPPNDIHQFSSRLIELFHSRELLTQMGIESQKIVKGYSLARVGLELSEIYSGYIVGEEHETKSKYSSAYL